MLLLRAHVLALGHSGVRPLIVDRMVEMLNRDLIPSVPGAGLARRVGRPRAAREPGPSVDRTGRAPDGRRDRGRRPGARRRRTRPDLAGGQGRARARERDPGHARGGDPRGQARVADLARAADIAAAMSVEAALGTDARVRRTAAAAAAASGAGDVRLEPPAHARRLAHPLVAPRQPASGAGRLLAPLRPSGARGHPRCAHLRRRCAADGGERRLRQPDRARRRRRGPLGRQLPRTAGRRGAGRARAGDGRARAASASDGSTACWTPSRTTASPRS